MQVAELECDHRYQSLEIMRSSPNCPEVDSRMFDGSDSVGEKWTRPRVQYDGTPPDKECRCDPEPLSGSDDRVGDFPYCWGLQGARVLTRQAMDALGDLIAPHVEFLPLGSADGEFTAFKVLTFIDALDLQASQVEWDLQLKRHAGMTRTAKCIRRYVFNEQLLANAVIFRIPQRPIISIYVTDQFMDRVKARGLRGFAFRGVWPPIDPSIERAKFLEKRLRKRGNA